MAKVEPEAPGKVDKAAAGLGRLLDQAAASADAAAAKIDPETADLALVAQRVEAIVKIRGLLLEANKLKRQTEATAPPGPTEISWWLPSGMCAFGLMFGGVAGLSRTQGVSQTLLTGVSAFVGGVLLTYAGFKRVKRADGEPDLDVGKVGAALFLFSLGTLVGAVGGASARYFVARSESQVAKTEADYDAQKARVLAKQDLNDARQLALDDAKLARQWAKEDVDDARKHGERPTLSSMPTLPPLPTTLATSAVAKPPAPGGVATLSLETEEVAANRVLRCKEARGRAHEGSDKKYKDSGFAATDAHSLYGAWCSDKAGGVCAQVRPRMSTGGYVGGTPVEDVKLLIEKFCP